jgi:hypothetical protein
MFLVLWVSGLLYLHDVQIDQLSRRLTNAIVDGDVVGVKNALSAGANVNCSRPKLLGRRENYTPPLGIASLFYGINHCDKNHEEICRILIRNGADYGDYFDSADHHTGMCATGLPKPCENKMRQEYLVYNALRSW